MLGLLACGLAPVGAMELRLAPAVKPTELLEAASAMPTTRSCAPDSALVSAQMGSGNSSAHAMRETLAKLGAPDVNPDATAAQLEQQLASAFRAKAALEGSGGLDNVTALRTALIARGETFIASEPATALLGRLVQRINMECFLVNPVRPMVQSLNLEDLQAAAYERLLTSTGTRTVLIGRLYQFQSDCDRMVEAIPGFACTIGQIEDALRSRGLSTVCSKEECLTRLVAAISQGSSAAVQSELCDIVADGAICLGGGKKVLTTDAASQGLVAHYTFDQLKGLDSSGNKNHAQVPPVNYGAGVGGKGHAAKFTGGTDYVEIRNHQKYTEAGNTFTVEMWMYLRQDSTGDWRTVLHKGTTDEERTPIIFLEPLTRGVEFFVSTTDTSQPKGERLWSNSFIPLHKWVHLACVAEGNSLRLYVNGLLDSENTTARARPEPPAPPTNPPHSPRAERLLPPRSSSPLCARRNRWARSSRTRARSSWAATRGGRPAASTGTLTSSSSTTARSPPTRSAPPPAPPWAASSRPSSSSAAWAATSTLRAARAAWATTCAICGISTRAGTRSPGKWDGPPPTRTYGRRRSTTRAAVRTRRGRGHRPGPPRPGWGSAVRTTSEFSVCCITRKNEETSRKFPPLLLTLILSDLQRMEAKPHLLLIFSLGFGAFASSPGSRAPRQRRFV